VDGRLRQALGEWRRVTTFTQDVDLEIRCHHAARTFVFGESQRHSEQSRALPFPAAFRGVPAGSVGRNDPLGSANLAHYQ
jgi:hypothetical protein